jgi:hypothetical protein
MPGFSARAKPVDLTVRFDPSAIGEDIDAWLADNEAKFDDIRPEATKEIVWAWPASRAKTPVALAVLHGFSAAKGEIRPGAGHGRRELGANLFFTRLAGHGRDGEAMAEPTVNDWIQDAAEAVAIGRADRRKGRVIANSTGGTLAALAATLPELRDRIDALGADLAQFRHPASGSWLLTWPFARNDRAARRRRRTVFEPHECRTRRELDLPLSVGRRFCRWPPWSRRRALPFEQIGSLSCSSSPRRSGGGPERSPPKSPSAGAGRRTCSVIQRRRPLQSRHRRRHHVTRRTTTPRLGHRRLHSRASMTLPHKVCLHRARLKIAAISHNGDRLTEKRTKCRPTIVSGTSSTAWRWRS